jgi:DNA-binding MarR family transcriptional regulator
MSHTEAPMFLSPCNATAMRKASRRITQLYVMALSPAGLRSTQYSILVEVNRDPTTPPTLNDLAAKLMTDRSALGHNLRPLEREGFIALRQGGEDRRQRLIVLTALGAAKFQEAAQLWTRAQNYFEDIVGQDQAAALRKTLLGIAHEERLASLTA